MRSELKIIDVNQLKSDNFTNSVVTIGIFDGVHKGHKSLFKHLKEKALEIGGEPIVITLWPHPRMVILPDKQIKLLSTFDEKLILIEKEQIQKVVVINFTKEFAQIPARSFISDWLIARLKMKALVLGYDNHFGHNKEGRIDIVKEESYKYGFQLLHLPPLFHAEEPISSTNIRLFLELGNIEMANELLGYLFFVTGTVIEGNKIGSTINFPTANIKVPEYKMLPRVGVYAVKVKTHGKYYNGMMNIGFRPTIRPNIKEKTIEVHLFDFNENLYNTEITVNFVKRIRDEKKFPDLKSLKAQLEKDKLEALKILQNFSSKNIVI